MLEAPARRSVTGRLAPGGGDSPGPAGEQLRPPRRSRRPTTAASPPPGSGRGAANAAAASVRRDGGGGAAFRGVAAAWGRPAAAAGGAAAGGRGGRRAALQMAAPSAYGECGEGGWPGRCAREGAGALGPQPLGQLAVAAVGTDVCVAGWKAAAALLVLLGRGGGGTPRGSAGGLWPVPPAVLPSGRGASSHPGPPLRMAWAHPGPSARLEPLLADWRWAAEGARPLCGLWGGRRPPRLRPGLGGACVGRGRPAAPAVELRWGAASGKLRPWNAEPREMWASGKVKGFAAPLWCRACSKLCGEKLFCLHGKPAFTRLWKGVVYVFCEALKLLGQKWRTTVSTPVDSWNNYYFFFFLLGSPDLLISKKMLIISINGDEIDSVLQNENPWAFQAVFKRRLKGWWGVTGKSSKAGSWFGICFHFCINLKLRVEDNICLSPVTLSLLISFTFLCLCRGRSLTLERFSSATPPFFWDVSGYLLSLLFDYFNIWDSEPCEVFNCTGCSDN